MRLGVAVCLAAMIATPASAFLDDFEELEGQTVIEAGDLKKLECPIYGDYNCLIWPTAFYRLNHLCIEAVGGWVSGYSLKGLLTVGASGTPSLFVYNGGIGSGDFKRYNVAMYDCPSGVY